MGRRLLSILALVAIVVASLACIEGFASLVITVGELLGSRGRLVQERYARYDPDLGWVSRSSLALPDLFGPGAGVHTTTRGLRGRVEPSPAPPPGKTRVVCSGGSWTFGAGVDDGHTWCAFLAELDPRLETINVGQDGYGVDQSYLWYRREGSSLAPALHLFGVTDVELARMASSRYLDYGKPTLTLRNGALEVASVPAWRRPFWQPSARLVAILKRTKTYELLDRLRRRAGVAPAASTALPPVDPAVADTAVAVLTELRTSAEQKGGIFVVTYLPTPADCRLPGGAPGGLDWWRAIAPRLLKAQFRVLDLSEECRRVPGPDNATFFFTETNVPPYGSAGLYTTNGHRAMALAMVQRLRLVLNDAVAKSR